MRLFQLPYLYQRVFVFLFAPTPWLELEPRRCPHTGGLQQSVDTVTSHPSSSPPAPSVVPMEETREENTADKESGRSQRTFHGFQTDHGLFQASVPQFADNVNSHPASLMGTHIRIQSAEGPKERSRGQNDSPVASQVINHRRYPEGFQLPKTARSAMTFLSREKLKKKNLSSGLRSPCCSLPGLLHHPGGICFAAGSLFSRDEWLSRPSHRPGSGLPPSQTPFF